MCQRCDILYEPTSPGWLQVYNCRGRKCCHARFGLWNLSLCHFIKYNDWWRMLWPWCSSNIYWKRGGYCQSLYNPCWCWGICNRTQKRELNFLHALLEFQLFDLQSYAHKGSRRVFTNTRARIRSYYWAQTKMWLVRLSGCKILAYDQRLFMVNVVLDYFL